MAMAFPPELEQFVDREVASGAFASRDELVVEAVRLLRETKDRYEDLRADLRRRAAQFDRGEGIELDDQALGDFLDAIDAEVDEEVRPHMREGS